MISRVLIRICLFIIALAMFAFAFAQSGIQPGLNLETILIFASMFTPHITTLIKKTFKTDGSETVIANAIVNAAAKGLLMVITGEMVWWYVIIWVVAGILFDQTTYHSIRSQKK